jgi:RNA polymerase subunit RPABC4/transcription elongation factor Spt4
MEKRCAICDRVIQPRFDLCGKCFKLYGSTEWAIALIKIEKHNYYIEKNSDEITFSDAGIDQVESEITS